MTTRKADYAALEREFITAPESKPVSRRELAKAAGLSNSTLSAYAREHDWEGKRQRFLDQIDEEFIRVSALKRARKLAELSERSTDVLEAMLIRAGQQLAGEEGFAALELAPRDVLDVIRQIAVARGDPSDIVGEKNVTVHTIDPRLIDTLGEIAGRALTGRPGPARQVGGADIRALPGRAEGAGDATEEAAS